MERIGIIGMGAGCGITARMALAEMDRREEEALRRAMDMEIESLKRAEAEADAVTHDVMRLLGTVKRLVFLSVSNALRMLASICLSTADLSRSDNLEYHP